MKYLRRVFSSLDAIRTGEGLDRELYPPDGRAMAIPELVCRFLPRVGSLLLGRVDSSAEASDCSNSGIALVRGGRLRVVDHDRLDGTFARFQFEADGFHGR